MTENKFDNIVDWILYTPQPQPYKMDSTSFMHKTIEIKSEKLYLRELLPKDVTKDYVTWLNDPEVNTYLESRFVKHTLESVKEYVKGVFYDDQYYMFGIFLRKNSKYVGNIKLGPINLHHKRSEIGLMIGDKSAWGRGVGTEAIKMVTKFGFNELNLLKISAGMYESNIFSKKSFEKVGYKAEGLYRNHVDSCSGREGYWVVGISSGELD